MCSLSSCQRFSIGFKSGYSGGVRHQLMHRYRKQCTVARKQGSGRPPKITPFVLRIIEDRMRADDETTATQLLELLWQHGISMSLTTAI